MANGIVKNVTDATVKNWYGRILGAWMQIKMIVLGRLDIHALEIRRVYGPRHRRPRWMFVLWTDKPSRGVGVALLRTGYRTSSCGVWEN